LHYLVLHKTTAKQCLVSAIYIPAQESQKDDFWQHLKHLHNTMDKPWCIMGDFNEMLHASEKFGGIPLSLIKVQRLNDFLHYSNSYDASVQGRLFT